MGDKKGKTDKSTAQILNETRNVLYGENVELSSVLNNVLTLLNRMDTRLCTIEKNTGQNTTTLKQMNDTLTSLTSRVITVESDVSQIKTRVSDMESSLQGTGNLFDEVKQKTDVLSIKVDEIKAKQVDLDDARKTTNRTIKSIQDEKAGIQEKLLDMQCRSMKNNLIFTGLHEQWDENCEEKLRNFINTEMNITSRIEFGNIHRFGKRPALENDPPRPIVARFLYYNDLVQVKRAGKHLRGKPFGVNEQFPIEIEQRRKQLYPIMKEEKRKQSKVVLVRDRLYVNDELVRLDNERAHIEPHRSTTRPNKRSRVSSTPDRE